MVVPKTANLYKKKKKEMEIKNKDTADNLGNLNTCQFSPCALILHQINSFNGRNMKLAKDTFQSVL